MPVGRPPILPPDELSQARHRDPGPDRHAEPRGGDVKVDDAHALALQIIGRGDKQARGERAEDQRRAAPAEPGCQRTGDLQEAGGIRVDVHARSQV